MKTERQGHDPEKGCGQLIVAGALALVMLAGLAIWWAVTH